MRPEQQIHRAVAGGRATESQLAFLADMERAGTCLAEGLDRALKELEVWGLLRGRCA
jgi:hypothetical protein